MTVKVQNISIPGEILLTLFMVVFRDIFTIFLANDGTDIAKNCPEKSELTKFLKLVFLTIRSLLFVLV